MNIVIAPDSFKGSLCATEAAEAMQRGFEAIFENAVFSVFPMADGGEGTLQSFSYKKQVPIQHHTVRNAYGQNKEASVLIHKEQAIIETASIVGLTDYSVDQLSPHMSTTFGVGEMISHALDQGCKKIIVGLGGSATNDGGAGMLEALGVHFWKGSTKLSDIRAQDLATIESIDISTLDPRLSEVDILIASDVNNGLTGPQGATAVFGPQKGVLANQVETLDQALSNYGERLASHLIDQPGAGAAGGLGFALLSIGGRFEQGAKVIAEALMLPEAIKKADLIITGEGKTDFQTAFGKVPHFVASQAKESNKPVILISGSLDTEMDAVDDLFSASFSIMYGPCTLNYAMEHAAFLTEARSKEIAKLVALLI
ncbi:glycerate kinase [Jeotgalibacillus marinus]|uniref:Glycerate kinase n=1 Tax=Jeotgalibacillus marinus TaxID=86667 RepID=A0ABV3Q5P4_9BACL